MLFDDISDPLERTGQQVERLVVSDALEGFDFFQTVDHINKLDRHHRLDGALLHSLAHTIVAKSALDELDYAFNRLTRTIHPVAVESQCPGKHRRQIKAVGAILDQVQKRQTESPQAEGVGRTGGSLADAETAGYGIEAICHGDQRALLGTRQVSPGSQRHVVLQDGGCDSFVFAVIERIVSAHHPLQARELTDHVGGQIGLAQKRCPAGVINQIRGKHFSEQPGQLDDPLRLLLHGSQFGLKNDAT